MTNIDTHFYIKSKITGAISFVGDNIDDVDFCSAVNDLSFDCFVKCRACGNIHNVNDKICSVCECITSY